METNLLPDQVSTGFGCEYTQPGIIHEVQGRDVAFVLRSGEVTDIGRTCSDNRCWNGASAACVNIIEQSLSSPLHKALCHMVETV